MPYQRRVKVVATLGPATDEPGVLEACIEAGLDVARLNCSHGEPEDLFMRAAAVRAASDRVGKPVALLIDIRGPKLRLASSVTAGRLGVGDEVTLVDDQQPNAGLAVSFDPVHVGLKPGERVLLDDGRVGLEVLRVERAGAVCRVAVGGWIAPGKGVNMPDTETSGLAIISSKDAIDLEAAVQVDAEWVALSFVASADNVNLLRQLLPTSARLISKIERPGAVVHFDEIALVSDAVMIARGDLGVETSHVALPLLQKRLLVRAGVLSVPVVCATEMLESMRTSTRPTRAEVSDVANAVLDGADAVMLSAETATGEHPVAAIATMASIVTATGQSAPPDIRQLSDFVTTDLPTALAYAACHIAQQVSAVAICVFTETGRTARLVSQARPAAPIIAFVGDEHRARSLNLLWGCSAHAIDYVDNVDAQMVAARTSLLAAGFSAGDPIVCLSGAPHKSGSTNRLFSERI